jgi:hypothetical protein
MKIFFILTLTAVSASAATTSISFWAYDQHAQNSPYYSHYMVTNPSGTSAVVSIDLNDRGWGFSTTGTSSYHVSPFIESNGTTPRPLRSIGWHQYEFIFNDLTKTASILMNGNTIQSGSYTNSPALFRFAFHDYYGGVQETVIDDLEYRINGVLEYSQGFESSILDSGWSITYQNAGTYVSSGDTTRSHTGVGSLALGATSGGNLFSAISFDLASIPEPSSSALALIASTLLIGRRRR